MKNLLAFYNNKQGWIILIAALLAIIIGWLAHSPNPDTHGALFYFLEFAAIPSDLFKAAIKLVVPILVGSSIFVVAAGGAIKNQTGGGLAGKKMAFVSTGFLAVTTPIACLIAVFLLQHINPADQIDTAFIDDKKIEMRQEQLINEPFADRYLKQREEQAIARGEFTPYIPIEKHAAIKIREKIQATFDMNLFRDMSFSNMLQLVFAVLVFGFAINYARSFQDGDNKLESNAINHGADNFIKIAAAIMTASLWIIQKAMVLIPFVVFGLVSTSIAESGLGIISSLIIYMIVFLSMLLLYMCGFYSFILKLIGVSPIQFFRLRKNLAITAFTTSSSSAVMGMSMNVAKEDGVDAETANIAIPMGATVNMDGTAMYQIFVAMFLMGLSGIDTGVLAMLPVVIAIVLASMGTPGAPGASLFILMPILSAMGIDENLVILLLAVDRPLDMSRTVCNVMGDQVMAKVAHWYFHKRHIKKVVA